MCRPNGEPIICYHGTTADISSFRVPNHDRAMAFGPGIYFTDLPSRAKPYAKGSGANITPVYLSMQKPKYYEKENFYFDEIGVNGFFGDNDKRIAMTEKLKQEGYDGLIIGREQLPGSSHEYVVFAPNQIKSIYSKQFSSTSDNLNESTNTVLYHGGDYHTPHDSMFFSSSRDHAETYGPVREYEIQLGQVFDSLDRDTVEPLLPLHDTYDDADITTYEEYEERSSDTWEMIETALSSIWGTGADSVLITEGGYTNYLVRDKSRIRLLNS